MSKSNKLGLAPFDASDYLDSEEAIAEYFDSVREKTLDYVRGLKNVDFDFVPEGTPFPEFPNSAKYFQGCTIGRMFRQLIGEEDQHLGQISFVRGLQRGLDK